VDRFGATGALDPAFGVGGSVLAPPAAAGARPALARDLLVLTDGAILVTGTSCGGTSGECTTTEPVLWRMLPSGALDLGFGSGGVVQLPLGGLEAGVVQAVERPGGETYVLTSTFTADTNGPSFVHGFTDRGLLDTSFGAGGVRQLPEASTPELLAVDSADRAVLVGYQYTAVDAELRVERLRADGADDAGFANALEPAPEPGWLPDLSMQTDGRIVITLADDAGLSYVRLLEDGDPDLTIGPDGRAQIALVGGDVGHAPRAAELDGLDRVLFAGIDPRTVAGSSDWQETSFVGRLLPPALEVPGVPRAVSASGGAAAVTVNWSPPISGGARPPTTSSCSPEA